MTRLRDLGVSIGSLPTGPLNAITDVAGVRVGHATVIHDAPECARTGVTILAPPEGACSFPGGRFSFNGNGEMTGVHWLDESGLFAGPIGITNTHQVGLVRDELVRHEVRERPEAQWYLPIVAETYDGFLNDIDAFPLRAEHVTAALAAMSDGPVGEGNVGGGTGMICHQFKGGIGTASRQVDCGVPATVGVLVQTNYGTREQLRLDGAPIGRRIDASAVPLPSDPTVGEGGSIIVIIATDAPLVADQCQRLARRATVGLARVGGTGNNSSGDLFLAFSTGNRIPHVATAPLTVATLPPDLMTPLFHAVAESVEEAIWNALVAADTMVGYRGRTVHAIPHELIGGS